MGLIKQIPLIGSLEEWNYCFSKKVDRDFYRLNL